MPAPLAYECVICTRNRPDALALSIPRLLQQTRPAQRIIVADASDDHAAIRALVAELGRDGPCEVSVIESPRGSSVQRNRGLALVTAPVVIFPDDDSLCDADYAERLLEIYEHDAEEVVGCIVGSPRMSLEDEPTAARAAGMSPSHRLRQLVATPRMKLERRLVLDPLIAIAEERTAAFQAPAWLDAFEGEPNCWVRGFRMSFRTSAVRAAGGFDETLRDYATFEDTATGFAVGERAIVFQARHARVYHHQTPGGRGAGRVRGATNIANRAYVVARHTPVGSAHRRRVVSYGAYRCLLYGLGGVWSAYHRESFRGAVAVMRRVRPLLLASPERAGRAYESLLRGAGILYD